MSSCNGVVANEVSSVVTVVRKVTNIVKTITWFIINRPNDTLYDDSSIYCKILVISYFYFEMVMFHWEGMKMICT